MASDCDDTVVRGVVEYIVGWDIGIVVGSGLFPGAGPDGGCSYRAAGLARVLPW